MKLVYHNHRVIMAVDQIDEEQLVQIEMDYPGMEIYTFAVALEDVFQQMLQPKLLMDEVSIIRNEITPIPVLQKAFNRYHAMITAVSMAWYKFNAEFEYSGRIANDEFIGEINDWYKQVKFVLAGVCDDNIDQYNRPILVEAQNWIERVYSHAAAFDLASKKVEINYADDYPIIEGSEVFVRYITSLWDEACAKGKKVQDKESVWGKVLEFLKEFDPNSYDGATGLYLDTAQCIERGIQNPYLLIDSYMDSIIADGHIRTTVMRTDFIDGVPLVRILIDEILQNHMDTNEDASGSDVIGPCMGKIWDTYYEFLSKNGVDQDILTALETADERWRYALVDDMITHDSVCRIRLRKAIIQMLQEQAAQPVSTDELGTKSESIDEPEFVNANGQGMVMEFDIVNGEVDVDSVNSYIKPVDQTQDLDDNAGADSDPTTSYPRGMTPTFVCIDENPYNLDAKFIDNFTEITPVSGVLYPHTVSGIQVIEVDDSMYVPLSEVKVQTYTLNGQTLYTRPLVFNKDVDVLSITEGDHTDILIGPFGVGALVVKLQLPNDEGGLVWTIPVSSQVEPITIERGVSGSANNCLSLSPGLVFVTPTIEFGSTGITKLCSDILGTNRINLEFEVSVDISVQSQTGLYNVGINTLTVTKLHTVEAELDLSLPEHAEIRDAFLLTALGYYPKGTRGNLNSNV